jgi:hypothetical protein
MRARSEHLSSLGPSVQRAPLRRRAGLVIWLRSRVRGLTARSLTTSLRASTVLSVSGNSRATSSGNTLTLDAVLDHQRSRSERPFTPKRAAYGFGLPPFRL